MTTPTPITGWKKLAICGFFIGVGIAMTLSVLAGAAVWYESRPKPVKLWDTRAVVADGSPAFWADNWISQDGKTTKPIIVLQYELENRTDVDYTISSRSSIKFIARDTNGALTPNSLPSDAESDGYHDNIELPLFVPAKQKAYFRCDLASSETPAKGPNESKDDYHERLRSYLDKEYEISGLEIFDEANHYQIDLPKWASKRP